MPIQAGGNGLYKVRLNSGALSSVPAGAKLVVSSPQGDATISALDANLQFTVSLPAGTSDSNLHLEVDATNADNTTATGTFDDAVVQPPPPDITTVEIIKLA